jgi:mRNA-degrading endonuclease RelE of RelBE toxin-antitoxin system
LLELRHWRILRLSRFIETPTFTRLVYRYLTESDFRDLQLSIAARPEQGALIAGTKGLRKLRCKGSGRGKRGGLRVVYYWKPDELTCYLLFIYAKNEQGDLTVTQARALSRLVEEEFE